MRGRLKFYPSPGSGIFGGSIHLIGLFGIIVCLVNFLRHFMPSWTIIIAIVVYLLGSWLGMINEIRQNESLSRRFGSNLS